MGQGGLFICHDNSMEFIRNFINFGKEHSSSLYSENFELCFDFLDTFDEI